MRRHSVGEPVGPGDATTARVSDLPLPTLLSRALLQLARDYYDAGRRIDHPSAPTLVAWANVLRYVDTEGMLVSEVPMAARLSRRITGTLLPAFERTGTLLLEAGAARGKKTVRLTPA